MQTTIIACVFFHDFQALESISAHKAPYGRNGWEQSFIFPTVLSRANAQQLQFP